MSLQTGLAESNLRRATAAISTGLVTFGVTALLTYSYLELQKYHEQRAQWVQIQSLAQTEDFEGCLTSIPLLSSQSRYFKAAQPLLYRCRLGQAKVQARNQDWAGAIASANLIPESSTEQFQEAQPLIADWSGKIFDESQAALDRGELDKAIALLHTIPDSAPRVEEAHQAIRDWPETWKTNEAALEKAKGLLEKGQWLAAKQSLETLPETGFWSEKAAPLSKQAEAGIAAVEQYEREQQQAAIAAAAAAAAAPPRPTYIAPAPQPSAQQPGNDLPISPISPASPVPPAAAPPAAAPPPPAPAVAAAPAPPPVSDSSGSFDQNLESLYQTYEAQGQATWDAWTQACQDSGGRIVDQGPEATCLP